MYPRYLGKLQKSGSIRGTEGIRAIRGKSDRGRGDSVSCVGFLRSEVSKNLPGVRGREIPTYPESNVT